MIDVSKADIVTTRQTGDGRFVVFTKTDVRLGWPLPWWGVVADAGGDGYGLLVRLDGVSAPDGWTARQLLLVARRRMVAEAARCTMEASAEAVAALDRAARRRWERDEPDLSADGGVAFLAGPEPSPYPWTVATCGGFALPMCPDPAGMGEGVTLEQLLIILEQLMLDAARALPHVRDLWAARHDIGAALAAEVTRLAAVRPA